VPSRAGLCPCPSSPVVDAKKGKGKAPPAKAPAAAAPAKKK